MDVQMVSLLNIKHWIQKTLGHDFLCDLYLSVKHKTLETKKKKNYDQVVRLLIPIWRRSWRF